MTSLPIEATPSRLDRYYLAGMCVVAACVIALNRHADAMQGIVPYYVDFKRIIAAGFDPSAGQLHTPTFPMWGYAWLLFFTENPLVLAALQCAVAILSVWALVRH